MGEFGWLKELAGFVLSPFKLAFYTAKFVVLLAMGVVFCCLYIVLWISPLGGYIDNERRMQVQHTVPYSEHSTFMLGTIPTVSVLHRNFAVDHGPGTVVDGDNLNIDPNGNEAGSPAKLNFCGEGKIFFTQVMQNDYWDHWYERKTGWLYQRYIEGSLNAYALRYVVGELKARRTPELLPDQLVNYVEVCPGGAHGEIPTLNDSTIPHIDIEFSGTSILGYCPSYMNCNSADDLLLHIERWGDTFAPEPPYSSGQKAAIDEMNHVGTREFWEAYAVSNGLNAHSVDKYWAENAKYVKSTIHGPKATKKEINEAKGCDNLDSYQAQQMNCCN